jgi:hypothetical protein
MLDIRSWNVAGEVIKYIGVYLEKMPNRGDGFAAHTWKSFWVFTETHGFFSTPTLAALGIAASAIFYTYASPAVAASVAKGLKVAGPVAKAVIPINIAGGNVQFNKSLKDVGLEKWYGFFTGLTVVMGSFAYSYPTAARFVSTKVSGLQFANQYYTDFVHNIQRRLDEKAEKVDAEQQQQQQAAKGGQVTKYQYPRRQDQSVTKTIGDAAQDFTEWGLGLFLPNGKTKKQREEAKKEVQDVEGALRKLLPPAGVCDKDSARLLLWSFPLSPLSGTVTDVWETDKLLMHYRERSINLAIAANDGLLAAKISEVNREYGRGSLPWFYGDSPQQWLMPMDYTLHPAVFTKEEKETIKAATDAFDNRIENFYSYENIKENKESFQVLGFNTGTVENDTTNTGFIGMERLRDMLGTEATSTNGCSNGPGGSSMNVARYRNVCGRDRSLFDNPAMMIDENSSDQFKQIVKMLQVVQGLEYSFLANCEYCSDFSKTPWILSRLYAWEWDVSRVSSRRYYVGSSPDEAGMKDWRKGVEGRGGVCGFIEVPYRNAGTHLNDSIAYCLPANSTSFEARIKPVCKNLP